jgi:hypothetical protein
MPQSESKAHVVEVTLGRTAGHGRRHGLIKKGHRRVVKVEQPRVDSVALPELLKHPHRRLLRKPTLPRTADDYGNNSHVLVFWKSWRQSLSLSLSTFMNNHPKHLAELRRISCRCQHQQRFSQLQEWRIVTGWGCGL